ncbi:restriction endonuclease [Nocardia tengchongensis]|uniref:Restriction endonuclease n=1 Tax=Nocardia tengchongensis TaxID=2055889 RepID=A0ABX8CM66_9NOCA|nr:restriction endonuclease [Nocardia tengchongensis]QVI21049.1 restriction endonuclease [Nocardia tengchongensis]
MLNGERVVGFDDLEASDLFLDRIYAGKTLNGRSVDPLKQIFKVGVQGGIRFRGSAVKNQVRLVVLYSTGEDPDWRDNLDPETGILEYYGDNKHSGRELLNTHLQGNLALRNAFSASRGSNQDRETVSPFFYFERVSKKGSLVRFRGLAAPGAEALTQAEELKELWWSKDGLRFQNYRARFTILDATLISHTWIRTLLDGLSPLGEGCPDAWREWVETRNYRTLVAPSTDEVRPIASQLPQDAVGMEILKALRNHFAAGSDFREFALNIWRFLAPGTGVGESIRDEGYRQRFGGEYLIGPPADKMSVWFALGAEIGFGDKPINDIGQFISSVRYREFGAFITLSVFSAKVYRELRSENRRVALVCGRDVVEALRRQGLSDVGSVKAWLDSLFPIATG